MYVATYIDFFWFTASYYSSANAEDDKNFFQTKKYFPSSFFWLATSDETMNGIVQWTDIWTVIPRLSLAQCQFKALNLDVLPLGNHYERFPFHSNVAGSIRLDLERFRQLYVRPDKQALNTTSISEGSKNISSSIQKCHPFKLWYKDFIFFLFQN